MIRRQDLTSCQDDRIPKALDQLRIFRLVSSPKPKPKPRDNGLSWATQETIPLQSTIYWDN